MRVAIVVDRFPHETFLAQQVQALLARGIDVHVLCQISDPDAPAWDLLDRAQLAGRIHPWALRRQPAQLGWRLASTVAGAIRRDWRGVGRAAARERGNPLAGGAGAADTDPPGWAGRVVFDARALALAPDLVHFQFGDLARRRIHLRRAVDAVAVTASFRGYDLAYAGLDQPEFYTRLWPALDGIHTLGQDLRDLAPDRGCPPDIEWTLIPPGVDLDRFHPPGGAEEADRVDWVDRIDGVDGTDRVDGADRADDGGSDRSQPMRVVSVGRLHWKKGYLDALWAIGALRRAGTDVAYRLVGTGPEEESLRWAVAHLGLDDVVELVGGASPGEVADHLRWADVFLHPALTEGFANAVLEAQASGLAVVCTDAEGLAENVVDGITGIVVGRRDVPALTGALGRLAVNPEVIERMGIRGRERAATHFGLDRQTDAFIEFFAAAIDRRRSS